MQVINVTKNIQQVRIGHGNYVIWNRFSPSLLKVNEKAVKYIKDLGKGQATEIDKKNKQFIDLLLRYKILFHGNSDPSKDRFVKSVHAQFRMVSKHVEDFYEQEKDYDRLAIVNEKCNLSCSYCVKYHKNRPLSTGLNSEEKSRIIIRCIDQFFHRKRKNNNRQAKVSFNGGEILLDWKYIKIIVDRIKENWGGIDVEYSLNTNMTIMTEEIAGFLADNNFKVFISIDGYKDAHDRTRCYRDGKGSFDNIITSLKTFRKYNKNYPIEGFQGTIEYPDDFDPQEVYKMKKYGFKSCRLAPNLLNVSEEDAVKKARLMAVFLDLNPQDRFKVTETYFENMKKLINLDEYFFFFNCKGLSCLPEIELTLNIGSLGVSQLCSFIPSASVSFKELGYDIYNPRLWEVSKNFIQNRLQALFNRCMDCELIGICRGGCIYTALDKENQLNRAACAYQREFWRLYVKKVFQFEDSQ